MLDDTECEQCGEAGSDEDPVAHFKSHCGAEYIMAHGQCGEDAGLELS
jgi:hypothetical protein